MKKKEKKSIESGLVIGGATQIEWDLDRKKYGRINLVVSGRRCTIFKVPSTSHLDTAALERKARDMVKRLDKYEVDTLTW